MLKNENVKPRVLTEKEKEDIKREVYDTFASYATFCPACGYVDKTNMYLMRAQSRLDKLLDSGEKCPVCGKTVWELGYPTGTQTGFVKFKGKGIGEEE